MSYDTRQKGFTLLELLIVIAIIAILAAAVLLVINPGELLKKARDTQRVSDLSSLKSAIGLYLTDVSSPDLDGSDTCGTNVWFSLVGGSGYSGGIYPTSTASATLVDGNGWIPIDFTSISTGSPLASLPIDPTNSGTLYYTYACDSTNLTYETDAKLESTYYATSTDKDGTDGGNASTLYEVGTDPGLDLLGTPTSGFYQ